MCQKFVICLCWSSMLIILMSATTGVHVLGEVHSHLLILHVRSSPFHAEVAIGGCACVEPSPYVFWFFCMVIKPLLLLWKFLNRWFTKRPSIAWIPRFQDLAWLTSIMSSSASHNSICVWHSRRQLAFMGALHMLCVRICLYALQRIYSRPF